MFESNLNQHFSLAITAYCYVWPISWKVNIFLRFLFKYSARSFNHMFLFFRSLEDIVDVRQTVPIPWLTHNNALSLHFYCWNILCTVRTLPFNRSRLHTEWYTGIFCDPFLVDDTERLIDDTLDMIGVYAVMTTICIILLKCVGVMMLTLRCDDSTELQFQRYSSSQTSCNSVPAFQSWLMEIPAWWKSSDKYVRALSYAYCCWTYVNSSELYLITATHWMKHCMDVVISLLGLPRC